MVSRHIKGDKQIKEADKQIKEAAGAHALLHKLFAINKAIKEDKVDFS
mgnify:CR=1 FL=1